MFSSVEKMDAFLEKADLGDHFLSNGKVEHPKIKKINLDLPEWLLAQLDIEASRAGVSRQPLIKLWLVQKLEEERKKRVALR
ncbi:MAG: CopG family transcriptional regulator [Deltaproteobacteria bacterium]|nr:CopG family transcriptional regulator [Deltaproteobacteria bacterium]MBI3294791.1 CopG family transcriptional regulator [Deltaproteobacteria bacterium]